MHCFQDVQAAPEHTSNYTQGQSLGLCTLKHWQIKKTRKKHTIPEWNELCQK